MLPTLRHPENLYCPICGCGEIKYWPEILEEWSNWDENTKRSYEVCACCDFGDQDFPYEDFE